jgi:hypothetical protein
VSNASAIWERALFPVHRNKTLTRSWSFPAGSGTSRIVASASGGS